MTPTVTLYTRAGCHLCDEALATLRRLQRQTPFALELVDITTDDALHRRYLERIPVIAVAGEELCDYHVDEALLLDRLHYLGRR
jgi:glutaredoxin